MQMPLKTANSQVRTKFLVVGATVLIAITTLAWTWAARDQATPQSGPKEKISLGVNAAYLGSALVLIASEKGFFSQAGLDVTVQDHTSGALALKAVIDGQVELATVAETPVMYAVARGQSLSVVATISTAENDNAIVARKDSGIATPADLSGKRVAVTRNSTGEYFLDTLLIANDTRKKKLILINLAPDKMLDALRQGDIDAFSIWEPFVSNAASAMGSEVVIFHVGRSYRQRFNITGKRDFVTQHPEAMKKLVTALLKAEEFLLAHPAQGRLMVGRRLHMDASALEQLWPKYRLHVSLDQGLITLLETEALWAMRNHYVESTELPNFFDVMYLDALGTVKPSVVTVIR